MTRRPRARVPGLDLRLLGPVAVVWSVTWVSTLMAASPDLLAGAAAAAGGVAALVLATARATLAGSGRRRRHRRLVGLALLLGGAAAVGVGLRVSALTGQPWDSVGPDQTVHLIGVVTSDPSLSTPAGFGGHVEVQAALDVRVSAVGLASSTIATRVPVRVVAYGQPWADLTWGQRVAFDGRLLPRGRADPYAAVVVARGSPQVLGGPPWYLVWTHVVRSGLAAAVVGLPADARGLLPALVVGDTTHVPDDLTAAMRVSGLAHVTAVSGANVVLLLSAVLALARWVGARGWLLPATAAGTVVAFVLVARPDPSVLRAAVMGLVGVAAVAGAGRRSGPSALLSAVLALLLLDPWLARSWGFTLSVAATGGLLLLSPRVRRLTPARWPDGLRDAVAVAVSAQLATAPLIAALSGRVSLLSAVANVVAAPAVGPATVLGVVVAALGTVSMALAHLVAWAAVAPVLWIAWVARTVAGLPDASWHWPAGVGGAAALAAAGLAGTGAVRLLAPRPRSVRVSAAAFLLAAAGVVAFGPARWPPPGWLFVACDVGQGDALVLAVARGSAVVVDAGPDPTAVDQCLHRLGVHSVPVVLLSHFHADHVEGLPGVLRGRRVGAVLVGPLDDPPEEVARVAAWTAAARVPEERATAGESDAVGPVSWQVLWPDHLLLGQGSDPNNNSLVLRVVTGGHVLLLTGDVEAPAQQALLAEHVDLRADVLKVPHHGSANQAPQFLAATGAALAVVSVGLHNTYGHPAPQTLDLLAADGMTVRRTDHDGDVAVVADASGALRVVTRRP